MAADCSVKFLVNRTAGTYQIQITDTSSGFTLDKAQVKITYPNGYVVENTDWNSPDISSAGGTTNKDIKFDINNKVLTGDYVINFTAKNSGGDEFTAQKSFNFTWQEPVADISNTSDVTLPEVKFKDNTSGYDNGNFTEAITTRTLADTFPSTSAASGASSISNSLTANFGSLEIDMVNSGNYYEGDYTPTLTMDITYTHSSNSWLTVQYIKSHTETIGIKKCPTQNELLTKINTYKTNVDSYKSTNSDTFNKLSEEYDLVIALYSHLIDRVDASLQDGSEGILRELLGIVEPYEGSYTYQSGAISAFTTTGTESTQDILGAMVSGNTETGIAVTYNDTTGKLNFVTDVTLTNSVTLTNKTLTSPVLNTGVSGTAIKDEDNMSSNSATHLATQQSIKAYVDSQVDTVDTLSEILAIGNITGGTKIKVNNTSSGIDFIDNAKLRLGTGDDNLEIYQDGTNSFIQVRDPLINTTAGTLYINAPIIDLGLDPDTTEDGDVRLRNVSVFTGSVIKDEDNMASNSSSHLATQQSIKAYVDAQIATEDTIAELNDTTIGTLANGHLLIYDNDSSVWENKALSGDATITKDGVLSIVTAAVANNGTAFATGDQIHDAIVDMAQFSVDADSGGSVDVLPVIGTNESISFTGGTGINTSITGSGPTVITFAVDNTIATLTGSQTLTNKTIDVDNNTVSNIEVDNLKSGVLDTDISSVAGTDTTLASAKAIKTYVDSQVTAQDLDFQGDSGGALSIDLDSETLTFTGGTGIDTSGSGNTITFAIDSTVATLTGSQTLTNKSLTAPTLTGDTKVNGDIDMLNKAGDGYQSFMSRNTLGSSAQMDLGNIGALAASSYIYTPQLRLEPSGGGAQIQLTTVQTSSASFVDNDTSLMTSAAIDDRINAATPSTITVVANNSTDETVYLLFVDGATGAQDAETDTGLTYNPSTGLLTSTSFSGNLTGNVTGNVSGTAATVTGAAQPNITSLGTLTTLTVDDITINGSEISDSSSLTIDTEGDFIVESTNIRLRVNGTENAILADANAGVTLYYDSNARISATNAGATVTGTLTADAFSGPLTGTATGLSGTPNITVGTISSGNITTSGYLRGPASFTIDPATHGDDTGTVVIAGNLQVDGTTTTINSTTVAIDDLNFSIATDAADSAAANGAGITIGGASATLTYTHADTSWNFNKPLNVTGNITSTGDLTASQLTIDDYIYHAGDTNTYIYFETDSIKLRAGGTDWVTHNSAGSTFAGGVLIPDYIYHVGDTNSYFGFPSADNWKVYLDSADRLTINSTGATFAGSVGVGATASDFHADADDLVVGGGSGNTGITIQSGTSGYGSIFFADGTADDATEKRGQIRYLQGTERMDFHTDNVATAALSLAANGNATFAGNTDNYIMYLNTNNNAIADTTKIVFNDRGAVGWNGSAVYLSDDGSNKDLVLQVGTGNLYFKTNDTTRVTIADSTGNATFAGNIDAGSNSITAGSFVGNLSGNVNGNVTGNLTNGTLSNISSLAVDNITADGDKVQIGAISSGTLNENTGVKLAIIGDSGDNNDGLIITRDNGSQNQLDQFINIYNDGTATFVASGGTSTHGTFDFKSTNDKGDTSVSRLSIDASGNATFGGALVANLTNGKWRVNTYGAMYFRNSSNATHESYIHSRSDGSLSIGRVAESDWTGTGNGAYAATTYDHLTFDTSSNATFAGDVTIPEYIYHANDTDTKFGFSGADAWKVNTGGSTAILAHDNGSTYLYHSGSQKFNTTSSGVTVTGNTIITDTANPDGGSGSGEGGSLIVEGRRDGTANLISLRARDLSAPTVALPNGQGGLIRWQGFDGADFAQMGAIAVVADGQAVANADAPSKMIFYTTADGGEALTTALTLDKSQNATFAGDVRINGNDLEFNGAAAKISGTSGGQISLNYNTTSNQPLIWYGGGTSEQFKVTNAGVATFAGTITSGNIAVTGSGGGNGQVDITRTSGASIRLQSQSALAKFGTTTNHGVQFMTNDTGRWNIQADGHMIPVADSSYDIGSDGTRVRNLYADTLYGDGSNLTGVTGEWDGSHTGNASISGNLSVGGTHTALGLLHLNGTGDAIRVESTNTGSGGAQIDLLHFTTSPADEDINGLINFGGYYTGTTSVYGASIRSYWTDVSERHGRLEFWTTDETISKALTLAHDNSATFAGQVKVTSDIFLNPDYVNANEYLYLRKHQSGDGGIIFQSKTSGGSTQSDFQVRNQGSSGDLKFYAYGLADEALILDRENGNATFGGNIRTTADIGRDDHNRIMFSTDDSLIYRVADSHRFRMNSDNFSPYVDSSYDLGTSSLYFRHAYIDAITTTGNVTASSGTGHFSLVNASAYQLNGTYVMDSSRNLVNIGTITSDNITTQSRITFDYGGDHYMETGTNTLSFKASSGTVQSTFNFSDLSTTFAGNVSTAADKRISIGTWDNSAFTGGNAYGYYVNSSTPILILEESDQSKTGYVGVSGGNMYVGGVVTNLILQSGSGSNALTIDSSQNATFAGDVSLTGGALSISGDGSNAATLTESSAGILTIATVDDFKIDAGGDISLDAEGADIRFKDGTTHFGTIKNDSSHLVIEAATADKDIIFKGTDNTTEIDALRLDMSDKGSATFSGSVNVGNPDYTSSNPDGILKGVGNDGVASSFRIYANSSDNARQLWLGTSGAENTMVLTGGKVGIGPPTVNAAELLHLFSSAPAIRIQDGGDKASNASGYIDFYDHDSLMMQFGVDDGGGAGINLVNNNTFTLKTNNSVALQVNNSQKATFSGHVSLADGKSGRFGDSDDLKLYHASGASYIENDTGDLNIIQNNGSGEMIFTQNNNDGNINFNCDDGSNGVTTYMSFDGGDTDINVYKDLHLADSINIRFGTGLDARMFHDGSNTKITNGTGGLYLGSDTGIGFQSADHNTTFLTLTSSAATFTTNIVGTTADFQPDADSMLRIRNAGTDAISIFADTGDTLYLGGNNTTGMYLDASAHAWFIGNINMAANQKIYLGGSTARLQAYHTGSSGAGYIVNKEGGLNFVLQVQDANMVFSADNGEANNTQADYFSLDGGSATHDGSATTALYTKWADKSRIALGSGKDLQLYHDGSNSYIRDTGTGSLFVQGDNIYFRKDDFVDYMASFVADGAVSLYYDNSKKFETTNTGISVTGHADMDTGNSSGKFAVMSSAVHASYDFYNNGTSYFNGAVTVDDALTMSGTNAQINLPSLKGVRLHDNTTQVAFELPYFTNATADLAADIILGNHSIYGILELTLTAGYSHQNAVGEYRFKWILGVNANNSIWYTPQLIERRVTHHGPSQIYVADPAWDSTNSRYYIRVYHKASTGNNWEGHLKYTSLNSTASDFISNLSISGLLTSTSTANSHPVGHFLSDQTGDMNLILQSKASGDPTLTFNSEAANRSGVINFQDNGTQMGQIIYTHNGDAMTFLTGGTGASHEELTLNETNGGRFRTRLGVGGTNPGDRVIYGTGSSAILELESTTANNNASVWFRSNVSGTSADRWEIGTNISQGSGFELYNRALSGVGFFLDSSNNTYLAQTQGTITTVGPTTASTTSKQGVFKIRGKNNYSDGSNWYGDYGQLLFMSSTNMTGSSRSYLMTNAYLNNRFAFIQSSAADNEPVVNSTSATQLDNGNLVYEVDNSRNWTFHAPTIFLNGSTTDYMLHDGTYFKFVTSDGYIQIGPANSSYCHIQTDRARFYMNRRLIVDEGIIGSYDEDLILRRADDSSYQMTLSTTAATFTHDVVAFSDKKLKENIKTLDGSKVYDMRGVSFTKKDNGKEGSGVIAQEIQKVAPELINETDGTLGVAYGNLTGYLIEAVKDLKKEVEDLKKQLKNK